MVPSPSERGCSRLLPAAALDITELLSNLAKRCVVEYVEARDVEPLHQPAALGVALPAPATVHAKGRAVEMNGESPRHLAGGVAQVDRVAIAQVRRHRVVPAADTDQNPIQDASLIDRAAICILDSAARVDPRALLATRAAQARGDMVKPL